MLPLLGLIVFLGVYPKPVLDRIEPSVKRIVTRTRAAGPELPRRHRPRAAAELAPVQVARRAVESRLGRPRHGGHPMSRPRSSSPQAGLGRAPLARARPVGRLAGPAAAAHPPRRRHRAADRLVAAASAQAPRGFYATFTVVVAAAGALSALPALGPGPGVEPPACGGTSPRSSPGRSRTIGGAVGVDGFSLFVTIVLCIAVALVGAADRRLPAPGGPGAARVLRAAAAVGRRRHHHGRRQRPDRAVHRPRDAVDRRLRAGRHAAAAGPVPGGGPQVLRARRLLLGVLPLRHRPRLRRHRLDQPRRHQELHGPDRAGAQRAAADRPGHAARRARLQGRRRAVPRLEPRRLRRLPDPGRRLDGLRGEGRGLRRAGAGLRADVLQLPGDLAADRLHPGHPLDGRRRRAGGRAEQRQADAGVLVDQPRRVPAHGARGVQRHRQHRHPLLPGGLHVHGRRLLRRGHARRRDAATAASSCPTTGAWGAPTPCWRARSPCSSSPRPGCRSPPGFFAKFFAITAAVDAHATPLAIVAMVSRGRGRLPVPAGRRGHVHVGRGGRHPTAADMLERQRRRPALPADPRAGGRGDRPHDLRARHGGLRGVPRRCSRSPPATASRPWSTSSGRRPRSPRRARARRADAVSHRRPPARNAAPPAAGRRTDFVPSCSLH